MMTKAQRDMLVSALRREGEERGEMYDYGWSHLSKAAMESQGLIERRYRPARDRELAELRGLVAQARDALWRDGEWKTAASLLERASQLDASANFKPWYVTEQGEREVGLA